MRAADEDTERAPTALATEPCARPLGKLRKCRGLWSIAGASRRATVTLCACDGHRRHCFRVEIPSSSRACSWLEAGEGGSWLHPCLACRDHQRLRGLEARQRGSGSREERDSIIMASGSHRGLTQSETGWLLANGGEDDWDDKEEVKVKHKGSLLSAHNLSLNPSGPKYPNREDKCLRPTFVSRD